MKALRKSILSIMTIGRNLLKELIYPDQPIFRLDRHRYSMFGDDKGLDTMLGVDQLRKDAGNVRRDFRRALSSYKAEKSPTYGEGE